MKNDIFSKVGGYHVFKVKSTVCKSQLRGRNSLLLPRHTTTVFVQIALKENHHQGL